ncbi:MAG: RnfH family protein [Pseudomonadales bacterium]|nr:RnfH family protein [Pseudomonadales bacterium]
MRIEVVYAQLEDQRHIDLELVEGADVAACLALLNQHPMSKDLPLDDLATGVFGEVCDASRKLQNGDRLELYRPLVADAKTARRLRAKTQTS